MFSYAAMTAINYTEIKLNPEGFSTIDSFINKYNWDEIKYA